MKTTTTPNNVHNFSWIKWSINYGTMHSRVYLCEDCYKFFTPFVGEEDKIYIEWIKFSHHRSYILGTNKGPDIASNSECSCCKKYLKIGLELSLQFFADLP